MKRIILILACLCGTLHAQQVVTGLNNGSGGLTLNTPGVTTYFGGPNIFNFVGSVVTGLPANVGNTFSTLAVTGTTQLNGNVGIGGPFNAIYGLENQAAFTIAANGSAGGYITANTFTITGNNATVTSFSGSGSLETLATGTFTGLTWRGGLVGAPTMTGSGLGNAYVMEVLNGPAFTSTAGLTVASQTAATNNTDILYGTTTIPTGTNYGIYQGDSYQNVFNGSSTFTLPVKSAGFQTLGTGSAGTGVIIGSSLGGLELFGGYSSGAGFTNDTTLYNSGSAEVWYNPTGTINTETVGEAIAGSAGNPAIGINNASGGQISSTELVKQVTAIANNTGTPVLTVTIPNAAHSGTVRVTLTGALGAGGAIGADEATGTISYDFAVARTAGVNAVTTISSAYGSAAANVAGATTITITAAASAVSGAVGATNTFTVNVTIARGGGASTNHTCLVDAKVINQATSGITIN